MWEASVAIIAGNGTYFTGTATNTFTVGDTVTIYSGGDFYNDFPVAPAKKDGPLEWLDRRVEEMRVNL
jgi:hypothetical protein